MRAVVQRVSSASVSVVGSVVGSVVEPVAGSVAESVAGSVIGKITAGLLVLVGVKVDDGPADAKALARKIYTLRILEGERSAEQLGAPLLVISQFTLYADTTKGRRPSWNAAAPGSVAEPLVNAVCQELRALGATVETGQFGAQMKVSLVNEGPFTLILES